MAADYNVVINHFPPASAILPSRSSTIVGINCGKNVILYVKKMLEV